VITAASKIEAGGKQGVLRVGVQAPEFEGRLEDGSSFRLSGERGRRNVVLYFYPADFSSGCTAQACSFRDSYAAIGAYDAIIVGVSRDSAESHRAFKEKHGLAYPIITDEDGSLAETYEVRSLLPLIRPRVTYVIDKGGVVRAAFRHDIAIGRHLQDTLTALEAIEGSTV
jgi:peroxiredoxin Q/BCP